MPFFFNFTAMKTAVLSLLSSLLFLSCSPKKQTRFVLLEQTALRFDNSLSYTPDFNPYTYRNFYNGAGVALGDINNDGLIDVYFTGNLVDNKLFLNKGNWEFEDITEKAGVACKNVWSTGATFADVNGDGLLDLYVCKSGKPEGNNRHNELFINQGNLQFKEASKAYGLDVVGLSVHAAFFDADQDGDLDCYVLNNSLRSVGGYDLIKDQREIPDANGEGNKFFENRNGSFVDVTQEKNIYSSAIGFGLGITLSDFNEDRLTDLYISNDFFERDYLYYNQGGTFVEVLEDQFEATAMGAMGADAADLNNDQLPDLFVTEMLPATLERQKTKAKFDSWDKYALMLRNGYYHQFPRNALQRNMGASGFFEVSRWAGVAATEWSWASLIFDMDNDGLNDIFVANGIYKDLLDRDYLAYMANEEQVKTIMSDKQNALSKLIDIMPSKAVPNVAFRNTGNFQFETVTTDWGLDTPSFSNGNAYGDLDNDGDLDLVVNNVNMPAFVYKNTTDTLNARSLNLSLKAKEKNTFAVGAKVLLFYGNGKKAMREQFPSRGFESSVSNRIHIGVGAQKNIDSTVVLWPNGATSLYKNLSTNQWHELLQPEESVQEIQLKKATPPVQKAKSLDFVHKENQWIDFNRERLIPQMYHNEGPALATADLNGDGSSDFFVGGAKLQPGALFISEGNDFSKTSLPFQVDQRNEDTDAVFFDGDNDGDLDLLVTSGGRAFSTYSTEVDDRYYLNNGKGQFSKQTQAFDFETHFSSAAVAVADFNQDGFQDVFLAERFKLALYGYPASGRLYLNQKDNTFQQAQQPAFENIGMITDAVAADLNKDGWQDLILVGEWMPITVLINQKGTWENQTQQYGLEHTRGLWTSVYVEDVNQDGRLDIVAGNLGENSFFKPKMRMYLNDFDQNGDSEQLFCMPIGDQYYPIVDKDELIAQLPGLKKQMVKYEDYSKIPMSKLLPQEVLNASLMLTLDELKSCAFLNTDEGFVTLALPDEIQYSSVYAITGIQNETASGGRLFLGGNQYLVKPQFGRYDASKGWELEYAIKDQKVQWSAPKSLNVKGQIRKLEVVNLQRSKNLLIGVNNDTLKAVQLKN